MTVILSSESVGDLTELFEFDTRDTGSWKEDCEDIVEIFW